jgi:hypothetical protein
MFVPASCGDYLLLYRCSFRRAMVLLARSIGVKVRVPWCSELFIPRTRAAYGIFHGQSCALWVRGEPWRVPCLRVSQREGKLLRAPST